VRPAALVLALVTAGGWLSSVAAQDDQNAGTISGLVRIVGSQAGIVLYCRKFYTINDPLSDGLARTAREALRKTLGSRQAKALIEEEGRRVSQEIEEVGAEEWCADQREILKTDNLRVFVD
jgi:hypothetical protein